MASLDTKQHILDTAEQLFAERGYAATSLRAVTQAAGVNLAAVNYHFGSKTGLLFAVVERRVNPVNAERLRLLDTLESGPEPPELEAVLRAFIAPAFSCGPHPPEIRKKKIHLTTNTVKPSRLTSTTQPRRSDRSTI